MKYNPIYCLLLCLAFSPTSKVWSQNNTKAKRTSHYNIEKGIAIQGYDPVAYFTSLKAVKGSPTNYFVYEGITYYFSTKANLEIFKLNPEKYEPAYGGWCAYAMGNDGSKVEIDPETFKIVNGRLLLYYNFYFNNTLKKWNMNEQALKKSADLNWLKIVGK